VSTGIDALVIGGGMIAADLILPSLYHLQRLGVVGGIAVCASRSSTLRELAANPAIRDAFPGRSFTAWPRLDQPDGEVQPLLYVKALEGMRPRQLVTVAVPDHLHHEVVMAALRSDQHVLCVKPLALRHADAAEICETARARGLFVGIEYHKRFDRRSLVARAGYRAGRFGEFVMGEARLLEPYRYRSSNFQRWFTAENTDPFTYIGCHYVDLVRFITDLLPVEVSVVGIRRRFPNGNEGFLWSHARVRWENGALLSLTNGLGYPDEAAGSNDQALLMYCEGAERSGMIRHDDHYRGVSHAYIDSPHEPGSRFRYTSPDFFQLVSWEGEGLRPIGYGFDSIEAIVKTIVSIEEASRGVFGNDSLAVRRRHAAMVDSEGLIATPANSAANDLVVEAGRLSILAGGMPVSLSHGREPRIEPCRDAGGNRGN
jgi:D-galacturonate reductase